MPRQERAESITNGQLAENVTSAPISRTQSLPTARFRPNAATPARAVDDITGYRRKSWFRNLGHKLGFERDRHASPSSPPPPTLDPPGKPRPIEKSSSVQEDFLKFKNPFDAANSDILVPASPESSTGSFKDRFRRLSKTSTEHRDRRASSSASACVDKTFAKRGSITSMSKSSTTCPVPELAPLMIKHVGFSAQVFSKDPPQIIPPLNPHQGNVEFLPDGKLVVTPSERFQELGLCRYLDSNHSEVAQKATIQAADNASRLHGQLTGKTRGGFFSKVTGENQTMHKAEESEWDRELLDATVKCPVPNNPRNSSYGAGEKLASSDEEEEVKSDADEQDLSPEKIYTRCCHLREIMPIKSMLRQLKDARAPITSLRICNTKPTMIEILAFSDFVTIVPVISVNLQNLVITSEMLRIILCGLERSKKLGRINLSNTKLDELGWKYLCVFMLRTTSLTALSLEVDFSEKKSSIPEFNRRDMDWSLFDRVLKARPGVELMDLEGTKIPTKYLKLLLEDGFKNGRALSVSRNNLTHDDIAAIRAWAAAEGSRVEGLDLSHNDLSQEWDTVRDLLYNPQIARLELNGTKLNRPATGNPFATKLISQRLESLDLSDNPQMFPRDLPHLVESLPAFRHLTRLSLNRCGITHDVMVSLCEAISHCHKLSYLSLKDNGSWTETSAAALCVAVRMSRSLVTVEADFNDWSEPHRGKLTKYCIENLERSTSGALNGQIEETFTGEKDVDEFKRDINSLTLHLRENPKMNVDQKSIDRVVSLRTKVREQLAQLLEKKTYNTLTVSEREKLISLYYYDGSLDRLIKECAVYSGLVREEDDKTGDDLVTPVDSLRPSLSRRSSVSSLLSLKKQEHEEGEFHKINTFLAQNPDILNEKDLDLTGETLRKALIEKSSGHAETLLSQLQKLHALDLEKILD
ncbi:MAP-ous protein 1 [Wickerhamiella sorbophila]|uniref:MAP-ous protein 1 n=1 Tax=Wickerhamiella sorbophila TaxID=45607 RepID=A0A2T0FEB2_9ASCO|nr:MAP-ous protein 1 [Wickerhamiella sorbophila]PRT53307.1 MAP-ous protein 1 [Wickerhamiella sorbophila]